MSIFGPLLWNMFQNDLAEVVKAHTSMYADEHPIVSSDSSIDKVAERLRHNGNKMTDWGRIGCEINYQNVIPRSNLAVF